MVAFPFYPVSSASSGSSFGMKQISDKTKLLQLFYLCA